jgi:hypothetical protein
LFCADVACNEETDACDTTDTSTTVCDGSTLCLPELCDEETDACVPGEAYVCNDNDPCTDDVCDPAVTSGDPCVYTDNGSCNAEGCTPGYWKNNAKNWQASAWPVGISPDDKVSVYFTIPGCLSGCTVNGKSFGNNKLKQALSFQGGDDKCGKAEILLRAAVAALLNSSSDCVSYGHTQAEVIEMVNAALASCNGGQIVSVAAHLDELNNSGCPMNQRGVCQKQ